MKRVTLSGGTLTRNVLKFKFETLSNSNFLESTAHLEEQRSSGFDQLSGAAHT